MIRPTKKKVVPIAVAVIAAAGAVSISTFRGQRNVPTIELHRDSFLHKVSAEGVLKAAKSTVLTVPMSVHGPVKIAWMVEDGSRVKTGDVVVRFDPTDLEKNLLDGKADLETANSKVSKQRAEGQAKLRNLERDTDVAELELDSAREFQAKDEEIFSRIDIIESEIDEKLAGRRLDHYQEERKTQQTLSRTDEALLAIDQRKANIKIQQAQEGLSSLEIKAPHDGIIVFQKDWRGNLPQVGDMAWRSQPLAEIPELDEMEAEVQVLEADAGGLVVERPALVALEAEPDRLFEARIRRVDKIPKPRARGVPVQYFGVTLELERTEPEIMKPGQRVRATLLLDERADALAVPIQAVFERDAKNVVYRLGREGFDPVEVSLGPSSRGRVVIEQGLEEGDVIALRDPSLTAPDTSPGGLESTPGPGSSR